MSQYMKRGWAAAMAMVRYIRSWFLAPRTNTPSAAASDSSFSRSVLICWWGGWEQEKKKKGGEAPPSLKSPPLFSLHRLFFFLP